MRKLSIAAFVLTALIACGEAKNKTGETSSRTALVDVPVDSLPASAAPMDSAAGMQAWMAYMTPGTRHQMLAKDNGVWKESVKMWMAPGAPPETMQATCTNSMILGGRYQQSVHKGVMMEMPLEGISTVGYDNSKKKFVMTWVDNMGTGIMNMEGDWDSTSNVIHLKGTTTDPMTGKELAVREDFTYNADGSQLLEMYCPQTAGGQEFKTMEIKLTRK